MSSIITAVFKLTVGLLVNKGRDKAAEKLKDGDVTDEKFRGLIVREIDDIKSKLDGLSKKDLLASISFFEEGIGLLYNVLDKARFRSEHGPSTSHAGDEACSLADRMRKLEIADLEEPALEVLSKAKNRFEDSRRKATEAFANEALEAAERILAMEYRVMATILETVDSPEHAIEPCRVCLKELNSLSAVQNSFNVQLKKGIQVLKGLVGKDERKKIISSVCQVNRVIHDVTQAVGNDVHLWIWPGVDTGEDKVDPLRDRRLARVLREQGMDHCCVTPWSFGQEGIDEQKAPRGIATNSSGQFIVGDINDVNMFDPSGQFIQHFRVPHDDVDRRLDILDVATDNKDNIYVLVRCVKKAGSKEFVVYEFKNTADLQHKFPVMGEDWARGLTVTNSQVLVLRKFSVDVYDTDGLFVRSFGEGTLKEPWDITATNDGRVMVVDWRDFCVHIFSEDGDCLGKFKPRGRYFPRIAAFHMLSEYVVMAGETSKKEEPVVFVEIFTKDGKFVRSTQIHEERADWIKGMTVTPGGRIAVLLPHIDGKFKFKWKVLVI